MFARQVFRRVCLLLAVCVNLRCPNLCIRADDVSLRMSAKQDVLDNNIC